MNEPDCPLYYRDNFFDGKEWHFGEFILAGPEETEALRKSGREHG